MTKTTATIHAQAVAQRWSHFPFVDSTDCCSAQEKRAARRIETKAWAAMKAESALHLTLFERETAMAIARDERTGAVWGVAATAILRDLNGSIAPCEGTDGQTDAMTFPTDDAAREYAVSNVNGWPAWISVPLNPGLLDERWTILLNPATDTYLKF